jgi:hypothetical protein
MPRNSISSLHSGMSRDRVRYPCAIGPPNGPDLARCRSTWIHWRSSVASASIVGNFYRAYAELDGRDRGCPLDEARSFAGMVAYNGGRPLRCLA